MSEDDKAIYHAPLQDTTDPLPTTLETFARKPDEELVPVDKGMVTSVWTATHEVKALLAPSKGLVWGWRHIEKQVLPAVAERLKGIPRERWKEPPLFLAGPILEALRFAGPEVHLRDLYVRLLATAMDEKAVTKAHPAFVEIIRQLTPDEARIVKYMAEKPVIPLLTVCYSEGSPNGQIEYLKYFTTMGHDAGCDHPEHLIAYFGNLCRLGLTDIPRYTSLKVKGIYEPLRDHPHVTDVRELLQRQGKHPELVHGLIELTALGKLFCEACVTDGPAIRSTARATSFDIY